MKTGKAQKMPADQASPLNRSQNRHISTCCFYGLFLLQMKNSFYFHLPETTILTWGYNYGKPPRTRRFSDELSTDRPTIPLLRILTIVIKDSGDRDRPVGALRAGG